MLGLHVWRIGERRMKVRMNTEELVCLEDVNSNAGKFEKQEQVDGVSDNEDDDPESEYQSSANGTCLQSRIPNYPVVIDRNKQSARKEVYSIAPGEDKKPVSFFTDKHSEELASPLLFPKGRFGYTSELGVKLSPIRYFNARLLHYYGRFASNPSIFFAQFIIEQRKISESINIAVKEVCDQPVTASQLKSNPHVTKSYLSGTSISVFTTNSRKSTILAKIYV